MSANWPWDELGLSGPSDVRAVKRAYAQRLKKIDRQNAEAFEDLRNAYQFALSEAEDQSNPPRPSMVDAVGVHDERQIGDDFLTPHTQAKAQTYSDDAQVPVHPADRPENVTVNARQSDVRPTPAQDVDDDAHSTVAEEAFWKDFGKVLDYPIPVEELENLLGQHVAQGMQLRLEVEERLFQVLADAYEEEGSGFHPTASEVSFIEETFGWLSDGVGFKNRLGYREHSAEILHALNRMQKLAEGTDPSIFEDPEYDGIGHYRTVAIVLWLQMGLGAAKVYQKDPTLNFGQVLANVGIFLLAVWVINTLLRVFARAMSIHRAKSSPKPMRKNASKWRVLRWFKRLRDNRPLRSVIRLGVSGLLAVTFFIAASRGY